MHDYLVDIGRIPLLTPSEEIQLGNQVQAAAALADRADPTPDERRALKAGQRAKKRMIEANLRLVVAVSRRYPHDGLDQIDLIQEGTIGLARAVEKFDPSRGYKFSTYAFWWIRQAMQRALDQQSRTIRSPVHAADLMRKVRKIASQCLQETGREPTLRELAEKAGVTEASLQSAALANSAPASLDARVGGGETDRSSLVELIASTGPTPETEAMECERLDLIRETIEHAMARMNDNQRQVLIRRFGLYGHEQQTLSAIGADMGLSRERIRQLEAAAMGIIKASTSQARLMLRE
jgi:RNA polymerase primary sigma factor